MNKSINNENLIVTTESYKLLSKEEISEIEVINEMITDVRNQIDDLCCELQRFDIAVIRDIDVCIGYDELSDYLGEYLNDRENYEQHFDEESDEEEDSDDEYNIVGELKSEL